MYVDDISLHAHSRLATAILKMGLPSSDIGYPAPVCALEQIICRAIDLHTSFAFWGGRRPRDVLRRWKVAGRVPRESACL